MTHIFDSSYFLIKSSPNTPYSEFSQHQHIMISRRSTYNLCLPKKLFLQKNSTSPIHATRYATTDTDHVLGVHVDSQNPNTHDLLADLFMNQPVGCFAKKEVKYVDC